MEVTGTRSQAAQSDDPGAAVVRLSSQPSDLRSSCRQRATEATLAELAEREAWTPSNVKVLLDRAKKADLQAPAVNYAGPPSFFFLRQSWMERLMSEMNNARGQFHARIRQVERDVFRAEYSGEVNPEKPDERELLDFHIATSEQDVRVWVEEMAKGLGYPHVVWLDD